MYMGIKELILQIEDFIGRELLDKYNKFLTILFIIFVYICWVLIKDQNFQNILVNIPFHLLIIFVFITIWFIISKIQPIPRTPKDKVGIYLVFEAEDKEGITKISSDILEPISEKLLSNTNIKVYSLDPLRKIFLKKFIDDVHSDNEKSRNSALDILKKSKGSIFIWGKLKKRREKKEYHIIKLKPVIAHRRLNSIEESELIESLQASTKREYTFEVDKEISGFKNTSQSLAIGIEHLSAIAMALAGNYETAIKIQKDILDRNLNGTVSDWNEISKDIKKRLSINYHHLARQKLYKEDFKGSMTDVRNSLSYKVIPEAYLALAMASFLDNQNVSKAFSYINRYKKIVKDAGIIGIYNEAFLYLRDGKYKEAIKLYSKLPQEKIGLKEAIIIEEVFNFNEWHIKNGIHADISAFIIGYILYLRVDNGTLALKYLEKYLKETNETTSEIYILAQNIKDKICRQIDSTSEIEK